MKAKFWIGLLGAICLLANNAAAIALQPGPIFSDGMLLQRGRPVPIWGQAAPGADITVLFAGQTKEVTADAAGYWLANLDGLKASTKPQALTIKSAEQTLTIANVLVGDVFIYIGDTHNLSMYHDRFLKRSRMGIYYDITPFVEEDKKAATLPIVRVAYAMGGRNNLATHPQHRFGETRRWAQFDPENWRGFPAFTYFFGRSYWWTQGVPVAVIQLGSNTLDAMTPAEGFIATPALNSIANEVLAWNPKTPEGKAAYLKTLKDLERWERDTQARLNSADADYRDFTPPPRMPGPTPNAVEPTMYFNGSIQAAAPFAVRGMILKTLQANFTDTQYVHKAEALIRGLRIAMQSPDAPVGFFNFRPPMYWEEREVEDQAVWMTFRQTQLAVDTLPDTSLLAAQDFVLDPRDPRNWAERAERWARACVNDKAVRSGPVYRGHEVKGAKLTVRFERVGGGLVAGDKKQGEPVAPASDKAPGGFELAGPDGVWHPAAARIKGETVVVTSEKVSKPQAVRYAWQPRPAAANLYNRDGFAALPFASR